MIYVNYGEFEGMEETYNLLKRIMDKGEVKRYDNSMIEIGYIDACDLAIAKMV